MTWDEFAGVLKNIVGIHLSVEHDDKGDFLIVHVAGLKIDYFLLKSGNNIDKYMAWHYIRLIRMLATFI